MYALLQCRILMLTLVCALLGCSVGIPVWSDHGGDVYIMPIIYGYPRLLGLLIKA